MANWKMICTDNGTNDCYTVGKIYNVVDGNFEDDNGLTFGALNFKSFDEFNSFSSSGWELIEENEYVLDITNPVKKEIKKIYRAMWDFAEAEMHGGKNLYDCIENTKTSIRNLQYKLERLEEMKQNEDSTEKRKSILQEAEKCVCSERVDAYGKPEDNFKIISLLWNDYLKTDVVKPEDVGVMMALLKIARISSGQQKEDNYVDAIGYLACSGGIVCKD